MLDWYGSAILTNPHCTLTRCTSPSFINFLFFSAEFVLLSLCEILKRHNSHRLRVVPVFPQGQQSGQNASSRGKREKRELTYSQSVQFTPGTCSHSSLGTSFLALQVANKSSLETRETGNETLLGSTGIQKREATRFLLPTFLCAQILRAKSLATKQTRVNVLRQSYLIYFRLGSHKRKQQKPNGIVQDFKVIRIIKHWKYNKRTQSNDVALLKLDRKAKLSR